MHILVVDDEPTNRLILHAMLSRDGHEIIEAENGQIAVDLFKEHSIDLVLLDVMMPVMDGYQAAKLIKEHSNNCFVPIIFLTAITDEDALVECIRNGGDDFLTKPYNRTILKAKIDALIRIRELYETVQHQNKELASYHQNLKREQEVAEEIFSNLMQYGERELPFINMLHQPAETFNGDIVLVGKHPSGTICIMVGDFTGHGLASALGTLPAAQIFTAMCKKGYTIAEIIIEINRRMKELLPVGMFLAAALLQINPATGETIIWNGGLPDICRVGANNKIKQLIPSTHLPLGVTPKVNVDMSVDKFSLEQGERLLIFSDGIIELTDHQGEMFGMHGLQKAVEGYSGECLADAIKTAMETFRAGAAQSDDITLLEYVFAPENSAELLKKGRLVSQEGKQWEFSIKLNAQVLKNIDATALLMQTINDMQGFHFDTEAVYLMIAELYTNALDYGVLKMDSSMKKTAEGFNDYYKERESRLSALNEGWISIDVESAWSFTGGQLRVRVEDSGEGFDYDSRIEPDLTTSMAHYGRGLALLKSLGCKLEYKGKGNIVVADYELKPEYV